MQNEQDDEIQVIDLQVGQPKRQPAKLTSKKRRILLEQLTKEWNVTKAALKVGVHRAQFYTLLKSDPKFNLAYKQIEQAYLDKIESVSISQSLQPSRDGFPDRKLQLQSRRSDVYGQKPTVQINQQFNYQDGEVDSMLTSILPE